MDPTIDRVFRIGVGGGGQLVEVTTAPGAYSMSPPVTTETVIVTLSAADVATIRAAVATPVVLTTPGKQGET